MVSARDASSSITSLDILRVVINVLDCIGSIMLAFALPSSIVDSETCTSIGRDIRCMAEACASVNEVHWMLLIWNAPANSRLPELLPVAHRYRAAKCTR
jgi:hypothetical protein